MPLPPETPPTPMPGKKSAPDKAEASTDKSSEPTGDTNKLTPEEQAHLDVHFSALDKLKSVLNVAGKEPASAGNQTAQNATDAITKGVADADSAKTTTYGGN
jgi:hypothetical protein